MIHQRHLLSLHLCIAVHIAGDLLFRVFANSTRYAGSAGEIFRQV